MDYAGESVAYMASLPLDVNVFNQVRNPSSFQSDLTTSRL